MQEIVNASQKAVVDQKRQTTVAFAVKKVNKAIDINMLQENKISDAQDSNQGINKGVDPVKFVSNGGFDPAIWGTMDTSKWQLDNNGNITGYTGDKSHIIIPNSADFAKAGKYYRQISISSNEMKKLGSISNSKANTLAISLTDNKKVKASDADWSYVFEGSRLKQANLKGLDTSSVTNMRGMFYNDNVVYSSNLTSIDVSNWDTSKVTNMSWMFSGSISLTDLDISNWNTSNVTDMRWMFDLARSLTSLDVSNWDTSNVTNMSNMFDGAGSLTSLDVSKWNTSNVIDMSDMFAGVSRLTSLDVSNWDTNKVTNMCEMFYGARSLTNLDVSKWDTSKVTTMRLMFNGASSLTNLDVSKWDTSKVTDMTSMFDGARSLTSLDVSNWDTSEVTTMLWMFAAADKLAIIVNNPSGWQHATDDMAFDNPIVITNNANILNATDNGDYTVDGNINTRSVIFNSAESPVANQVMPQYKAGMTPEEQKKYASDVVELYNQKLMQDYENVHHDREISYDPSQDMNDPVALARAKFVTIAREEAILDNPANYNKLHATATREYIIHNIDGSTTTITQSINYHRTGTHNLVTNKDTFTEWIYSPDENSVVVVATRDKAGKSIANPIAVEGDNCVERNSKAYFGSLKIKPKAGFKLVLDKPEAARLNAQARLANSLLPRQFFVLKVFAPAMHKTAKPVVSVNTIKEKQDNENAEPITSANAIKQGKNVIVKAVVKPIESKEQIAIHDQSHADSPINGSAKVEAQLADVQNTLMANNKQIESDVDNQGSIQDANSLTESNQKSIADKSRLQHSVTRTNSKVKSAGSRQNKKVFAKKASAKPAETMAKSAKTMQSDPKKATSIVEKTALMNDSKQSNTNNSLPQTSSANNLGMAVIGLIMSSLGITLADVKNKKHK